MKLRPTSTRKQLIVNEKIRKKSNVSKAHHINDVTSTSSLPNLPSASSSPKVNGSTQSPKSEVSKQNALVILRNQPNKDGTDQANNVYTTKTTTSHHTANKDGSKSQQSHCGEAGERMVKNKRVKSKQRPKGTVRNDDPAVEKELPKLAALLLISRHRSNEMFVTITKQIETIGENIEFEASTIISAKRAHKPVAIAFAFNKLLDILNTDEYKEMVVNLICNGTITLAEARELNRELRRSGLLHIP